MNKPLPQCSDKVRSSRACAQSKQGHQMKIEHRWMARMLAEVETCTLVLPWNREARQNTRHHGPAQA